MGPLIIDPLCLKHHAWLKRREMREKRENGNETSCESATEHVIWGYLTRLALQWILVKGFKLYSFQLPDL